MTARKLLLMMTRMMMKKKKRRCSSCSSPERYLTSCSLSKKMKMKTKKTMTTQSYLSWMMLLL